MNCNRAKEPPAVPARFLVACKGGHLDDFPWSRFVHRGAAGCQGTLRLYGVGVSGETSEVFVECTTCNVKRPMIDAFDRTRAGLGSCTGLHPQLGHADPDCEEEPRTLSLGASNGWFSLTLSALSIPEQGEDELTRLVTDHWQTLADATDVAVLAYLRKQGALAPIQAHHGAGTGEEKADLKVREWEVLSHPDPGHNTRDFSLREVAVPEQWRPWLRRVVLAERLRAVTALVGFTRISSPRDFGDELEVPEAMRAPISREPPTFVPATEVRGEGIFLQFDEGRLAAWCKAQREPLRTFVQAHTAWRSRRNIPEPEAGFPGVRYLALHTFAHETSCERGNKYLDRGLLVETVRDGLTPLFADI